MDENDKIKLVKDANVLFSDTLRENGLDCFLDEKSKKIEDDFMFLESYCLVTQYADIGKINSIFSRIIADYEDDFQKSFYNELYAKIENDIEKIHDPYFKDFLKKAYETTSNLDDLHELCAESEFSFQWESFFEKEEQDLEKNNTNKIKIKIGIVEEDDYPYLLCTANTTDPMYLKKFDQIFFESDTIISPEIALQEFREHLNEKNLHVPEPKIQKKNTFAPAP